MFKLVIEAALQCFLCFSSGCCSPVKAGSFARVAMSANSICFASGVVAHTHTCHLVSKASLCSAIKEPVPSRCSGAGANDHEDDSSSEV